MTSSPSTVDEKQLVELGIAVCKQEQSGNHRLNKNTFHIYMEGIFHFLYCDR